MVKINKEEVVVEFTVIYIKFLDGLRKTKNIPRHRSRLPGQDIIQRLTTDDAVLLSTIP
jgi:hypothetical protein